MALTPSTMLALGTTAPDFDLVDVVTGKRVTLAAFAGDRALLVMFICKHCPYVVHVQDELARIGRDYAGRGLGLVAICSNSVETHPADAPENLKVQAQQAGFTFPYLHDATQAVAKAYTAACTPDFFLFDAQRKLAYRGQLDETRPKTGAVAHGRDLRAAIDAVLAGQPATADQKPSIGCNIKWRPGNEPAYYG
jgi:peroxiredoxin